MPDFQLNSVITAPPPGYVRQVEAPKPPAPPKSQSDHRPENPVTSGRGPAVVLSGAVARPTEKHGQQAHGPTLPPNGHHLDHVV